MSLLLKLRWYFRLQWRRYFVSMLMLAAVSALNLVAPWLVGDTVDQIAEGRLTQDSLTQTILILITTGITIYVLRYSWRLLLYSASYQLGSTLRQKLYGKWLQQPAGFFSQYGSGDLMARATNDVTAVEMSAGEAVLALFDGVLVGLMVFAVMVFAIDWRLTLVTLIPWPFMAYAFWRINNELHGAFTVSQRCFSDLNEQALEQVSALRLLRAYGLENRAKQSFNESAIEAQKANLQVAVSEAKYEPVIFITMGLSFLIALSMGSWFIFQDQLTVGDVTKFTLYLGHLIWPMFAYGWLLNLLERGRVAYDRIDEILDAPEDISYDGQENSVGDSGVRWHIEGFQYSEQAQPAIHTLKGELQAGKTLGIVGETGAGKSTFVKLLGRLYESEAVSIHIGGKSIQQLDKQSLRQLMAFVPQEPFLFSSTIAENIALGKPNATDEEIRQAAQAAAIDLDIQGFPNGYQTPVGERGVTLSGGQKQRLSIARVMLMDAPIVILDDALSAVDVATEQQIIKNLGHARENRTTIVVSHRLTAVENADEIIVLKNGTLLEQGTHKSLIEEHGWYAEMYRYQQLEQTVMEGR